LDLDVNVQLERLAEENGITTLRYLHVNVSDISKSGLGFTSNYSLDIGTYYDTRIEIWTKEVMDAVIEIVRREEHEDGYQYGAIFIGMNDTDARKIEIYQLFNDVQ
jgi:predicted nucleic-acid-binding protein